MSPESTPAASQGDDRSFEAEARAQDDALERLGIDIWVGAEPTFTLRESQEPWWLYQAEGGDKEVWARRYLEALGARLDAPARLLRAVGRHYPDEEHPRFCYGAHWVRDGLAHAWAPLGDPGSLDGEPQPPPPVQPETAWLTVTPDPGVVEVNMAPARGLSEFLTMSQQVYGAAADVGLSTVRYHYNGEATDSGGGGQLTFGGPTPETSPFFRHAAMLPGLVRYLQLHPSLSFLFASECVGSASQGPRPDEGVPERFDELLVTLDHLDRAASSGPGLHDERARERLWQALAPLLVDGSGNSHRAEVNVEKLWNPHFPERGRLGLVELRAHRMQPTAQGQVAVAALYRAVLARVVVAPYRAPLRRWGVVLHDRLGLPRLLREDLRAVLADLADHGLGLGPALTASLLAPDEPLLELRRGGASLRLTSALEFWPLVGDVASQERSGARVVDSSARRLQVELVGGTPGALFAGGVRVPFTTAGPDEHLAGLRFRAFVPSPGFLPELPAHDPLELRWEHAAGTTTIALHQWRPDGGGYDGLPSDAADARGRRRSRLLVRDVSGDPGVAYAQLEPLPSDHLLTLDLRRPCLES